MNIEVININGQQGFFISVGDIIASTGSKSPPFLLCDGAIISQIDYPKLFEKIAHRYAPSTPPEGMFYLPDCMGRMPRGGNTGDVYGGSDEVTLNENQIPPHNHESAFTNTNQGLYNGTVDSAGVLLETTTARRVRESTLNRFSALQSPNAALPVPTVSPFVLFNFYILGD